jgi:hypothetical protein
MELILFRKYHPDGTNGKLMNGRQLVCQTIELPWLLNRNNVSCIPEGRYEITKRYTPERGWHLLVLDVPKRSGILFHPANDALKELKGCIAPVTSITGPGKGLSSRNALAQLESLLFKAFEESQEVFITIALAKIQIEKSMNIIDRVKAPTPKFFRVLRTIGLSLAAAGTAALASPIVLPSIILTISGYLVVSGSVLSAVSQTAVDINPKGDD